MNEVIGNAEGNGIKFPQERICFWGATSFLVVVFLAFIGFLGIENGSDGIP